MSRRNDNITLLDMTRAAKNAMRYVLGIPKDLFLQNDEKQGAVFHQFLILGEAATRISDSFRTQHPEIPWKKLIGLRNVLIHRYEEADIEKIWLLIQDDLPELLTKLELFLPKEEANG